jgi:hypothetical protein
MANAGEEVELVPVESQGAEVKFKGLAFLSGTVISLGLFICAAGAVYAQGAVAWGCFAIGFVTVVLGLVWMLMSYPAAADGIISGDPRWRV